MRELFKNYKANFIQAKATNPEIEQALIRVVFVGIITLYLVINNGANEPIALCMAYFCLGLLMFHNILRHPKKNERRQWIAMFLDVSATTWEQVISLEMAGVFVGVYLWLIVGYGLRYGTKFFKGCYIMTTLGFSIALYFSPYWSLHPHLAYGSIVTLLLVPPHTLRLLVSLEKATKEATLANEAKTNFLSNISHEMRTPLNGIIGASELLNNTELNDKQSEYLAMLSTSSTTLKKLINDVLDISKIEKGKVDLETVTFYLPDVIQRLQHVFNIEKDRKQLWLRFHVSPSLETHFVGSLQHIEQVLMNLLSNAIKFTQHGGIDVTILEKAVYPNFTMVIFRIQDTGIGISQSALPLIFEPFTQADSSITRRYGGSGLGTTIAMELVRLMNGDITVNSMENTGTTFEVTLPLLHATEEQILQYTSSNSESRKVLPISIHNQFNRKIRVLIADDNIVNRMILNETLKSMNCAVKQAGNGDDALDLLEQYEFDLMILDYNMPERNGLDAFRIYHSLPGTTPIRTVILTADATQATYDECIKAGVFQVLTKPVLSKTIQDLIEHLPNPNKPEVHLDTKPVLKFVPNETTNDDDAFNHSKKVVSISRYEPLLDHERLAHLQRLGGGKIFLSSLIQQFFKSNDQLIHDLGHHCLDLNFERIHSLAHELAGEAANIGLMPLSKQCRILMSPSKSDAKNIISIFQSIKDTYDASKHQLTQYQSKMK